MSGLVFSSIKSLVESMFPNAEQIAFEAPELKLTTGEVIGVGTVLGDNAIVFNDTTTSGRPNLFYLADNATYVGEAGSVQQKQLGTVEQAIAAQQLDDPKNAVQEIKKLPTTADDALIIGQINWDNVKTNVALGFKAAGVALIGTSLATMDWNLVTKIAVKLIVYITPVVRSSLAYTGASIRANPQITAFTAAAVGAVYVKQEVSSAVSTAYGDFKGYSTTGQGMAFLLAAIGLTIYILRKT